MYCDAAGRADPNGDYELINGKLVLRDGRRIGTSSFFMDRSSSITALTEAERGLAVSRALRDHVQRTSYLSNPPPFTAADEAAAIGAAAREKASLASFNSQTAADTNAARAVRDAAREAHKDFLRNAWRGNRT